MITVASLRKSKTESRGSCGSPNVEIVDPRRSCAALFVPRDLWILPGLRKTLTPRFPQALGRRKPRTAHRLHRPCYISLTANENGYNPARS